MKRNVLYPLLISTLALGVGVLSGGGAGVYMDLQEVELRNRLAGTGVNDIEFAPIVAPKADTTGSEAIGQFVDD